MKLSVVDLFSGIGGFTLGLERTGGFTTVLFCETDPYCQAVLKRRWPNIPIHHDIRTLTYGHIQPLTPRLDLVCGGFPCQDISIAGKRAGINGTRSGLWWEMLRVIREAKPRWLLIENVPHLRANGADAVLTALEMHGYSCWPAVVGAWAVGAPHNRDRVWILGHAEHDGPSSAALAGSNEAGVPNFLEGEVKALQSAGAGASRMLSRTTGVAAQAMQHALACGTKWPAGWGNRQYAWEAPRTAEPGLGGTAYGLPRRAHRLTALGNAVVPDLPELFGRFILLLEEELRSPSGASNEE